MMKYACRIAVIALISFCSALQIAGAQEVDSEEPIAAPDTEKGSTPGPIQFSGFWTMEMGQLVNYWMLNSNIQRQFLLRTFVNFGASKQVSERLQVHAFAEAKMYYNTFDKKYNFGVESFVLPTMYYSLYFHRMDAVYSFGDIESPFLQFTLGYFPYKYNPDVRDLGEYLYRSGTYPAYLVNDFDFPQARLAGLKVSSNLFGMLHQDILLTTETDRPPFFDFNLGYVISADAGKFLSVGVGGMYRSLIPANDGITMPHDPNDPATNVYIKNPITDANGTVIGGDTAYYTFSGLKLMGRLSFDPKRIFAPSVEELGVWGIEDLKLYGEIAILGLGNYPAGPDNPYGYDTLAQKMPIMLGLNIPTFKIFDVFTFEVEWYGCKYPNNFEFKGQSLILPEPCPETQGLDANNYSNSDNLKWAIYAKKSFKNGLFIVGQIALDHIRNETPIASSVDQEEALRTNQAWWWAIKGGWSF